MACHFEPGCIPALWWAHILEEPACQRQRMAPNIPCMTKQALNEIMSFDKLGWLERTSRSSWIRRRIPIPLVEIRVVVRRVHHVWCVHHIGHVATRALGRTSGIGLQRNFERHSYIIAKSNLELAICVCSLRACKRNECTITLKTLPNGLAVLQGMRWDHRSWATMDVNNELANWEKLTS